MITLFKNEKFNKINANWIFEYCICFLYMFVGFIGWKFSYSVGAFIMIIMTILLLFIFNDFKYAIPAIMVIIFSYNTGYTHDTVPTSFMGYAISLVVVLVLFTIYNFKKERLKKKKAIIGFLILSVSCIIPIFWNKVITEETILFYFFYFSWLIYAFLYFILNINFNKRAFKMFVFSASWLAVLISAECFFKIRETALEYPGWDYLQLSYYLGWGLCNEAGLMLCFLMPFIFYELIKSKNVFISILAIVKVGVLIVGIILTTSRGSYLFGLIELFILIILMIIFSRKRITNIILTSIIGTIGLLYIQLNYGIVDLFLKILDLVFYNGLGDSDRFSIWERAYNLCNENMLTRIFGSGIISEIGIQSSYNGDDLIYVVYHSTFFEILCSCGIVGIIGLGVHLFEKYKQLFKKDLTFLLVMGVGYGIVDLYGMVDNSFGMYYYMVPLILLMTILDNDSNIEIYSNDMGMTYETN